MVDPVDRVIGLVDGIAGQSQVLVGSFALGAMVVALDFLGDALAENMQDFLILCGKRARLVVQQAGDRDDTVIGGEGGEAAVGVSVMILEKGRQRKPLSHAVEDTEVFRLFDGGARRDSQRTMSRIRHDLAVDVDGSEVQIRPSDFREAHDAHVERLADHAHGLGKDLQRIPGQGHAEIVEFLQAFDVRGLLRGGARGPWLAHGGTGRPLGHGGTLLPVHRNRCDE